MLMLETSRPRRVIIPKPLDYSEIVERLQQTTLSDDDEEDGDNGDADEDEIKCVSIHDALRLSDSVPSPVCW